MEVPALRLLDKEPCSFFPRRVFATTKQLSKCRECKNFGRKVQKRCTLDETCDTVFRRLEDLAIHSEAGGVPLPLSSPFAFGLQELRAYSTAPRRRGSVRDHSTGGVYPQRCVDSGTAARQKALTEERSQPEDQP